MTDLHAAAQALGRKGGLAPKTITPEDRAARAERARGLAKTRKPRKTKARIEPYGTGWAIVWPDATYPNGENWEGGFVTREAAERKMDQ